MASEKDQTTVGELLSAQGGSIKTGPFGTKLKAAEYTRDGVPVISVGEIDYGRLSLRSETPRVDDFVTRRMPEYLLQEGDIVFGRKGAVDRSAQVRADQAGWFLGSDGIRLRLPGSCDSTFVAYQFQLRSHREWMLQHAAGSTMPSLNEDIIRRIPIVLPNLDEQRAIAGVLGALDDKIEQNRRTARALERLARANFRAWFVDFEPVKAKAAGAPAFPSMPQPVFDALPTRFVDSDIGPVPEGWEVTALSSVCTLVSGGTPKRSEAIYWGGDVPWYSVKDAPGDGEIWVITTSERITENGVANSAVRIVPKGCTIISARGTVGKLAMAGTPMAFNQSCYGLLPDDGRSFCFLHLLMRNVVADLQQRTHGSVFDTITRATFDGLLVTRPCSDVVLAFENAVAPLFNLLLALLYESSKLAEMRDYLLPNLLSGQVRVKAAHG